MRKIVCHIGLHKTATSTLQAQFLPFCPGINLLTTLDPAVGQFIHGVTCKDPLYFRPEEALKLIEARMSDEKTNLLSNEALSGPPFAGVIERGLDHRSPIIANLRAVFPDARVIIVLRRQDTFVRSLYRQYVKSGGTDTIRRYLGLDGRHLPAMTLDRFEFSTYLRYLFECFPAGVLVLTFEEFVSDQPRFLSRFCEFVGTDIPDVTLKRENATRLGYFGMNVTRVLNFLLHSVVNDGPIPGIPYRKDGRWHQRSVVEYLHDHWPGRPSSNKGSPLVEVGNEVWERFRENNRQIDRELGLGLDKFGYY